ncbi:MAG: hypothetical protein LUC22_07090 [Prevotella sp.]|nr:hypothetical protein [Prevotella sp.]
MTDSIHFNPEATSPYFVTLEHVHIDTSSVADEDCGLYVPAGLTVNLYLKGSSTIKGSVYGIYIGSGATLFIECELDEALVIEGDNGIYNLGNMLKIDGNPLWPETDAGKSAITARYYGIYSIAGLEIKATDMTITVTGSSDEEHTVAGIRMGREINETSDLSQNIVTIDASAGKDTYGIWLDGYAKLFCAYIDLSVSATKCVLHRTSYYGGQYLWYANNHVSLCISGPFDGPHPAEPGTGEWYCDSYLGNSADFVLSDYSDFPFHDKISTAAKVSYINRTLYKGWNTLCLPFNYATSAEEGDQSDEARLWIDDYTVYSHIATEPSSGSMSAADTLICFTSIAPGEALKANQAYLIHVDDDMLSDGQDEVVVRFTAMNVDLEKAMDRRGEFLKTVFHRTTLASSDSIFKLSRSIDADGHVTNYFNHSEGAPVEPYRAYMKTNDNIASGKLAIRFDDGHTTLISDIDRPARTEGQTRVYTISGQTVKVTDKTDPREAINGLPEGVYIIDGKKYFKH